MILKLLMELIKALLLGLLSLIPAMPELNWNDSLGVLCEFITSANIFVDLSVFGGSMIAIFVCYNARMIWSVIMWVVRKIPGVS